MRKIVSVRQLREDIGPLLDDVLAGNQVIITRRGKPVARLIPEKGAASVSRSRYPLRGSILSISDDFDDSLENIWEALEK